MAKLLSLSEVKEAGEIGTDSMDARLDRLIDTVQSAIERYCRRKLDSDTYTEHFDTQQGQAEVWVDNPPITSVTSVTDDNKFGERAIDVDDDVMDESEYLNRGEVRLWNSESAFTAGEGAVKVVYVGGYNEGTIPDELKGAWIDEVLFRLNHPGVGVSQQSADGAALTKNVRDGFAAEVADVLDNYKLWHKGSI